MGRHLRGQQRVLRFSTGIWFLVAALIVAGSFAVAWTVAT